MLLINELLFQSETGPNYYKEVPLSEILSVEKSKKATDGDFRFVSGHGRLSFEKAIGPEARTSEFAVILD